MQTNLTEIISLLDRSGSMGGLEEDTIRGYNDFVEKQSRMDGEAIITTVLFDDKYEVLWDGIDIKEAKITEKEYFVRGYTALLDAVGKTIIEVGARLSKTEEGDRPDKVIFVIITDGKENASREFTYEKVNALIKHQKDKYNWEFVFFGSNIDVEKEAENLGIPSKNTYRYVATKAGLNDMYGILCEAVCEIRGDDHI